MRKDANTPAGTAHRLTLESRVLHGNPLGDAAIREIHVYVPAGQSGKDLPLLVDLVGFTAGGPAHTNWRNFTENVPEQADRLIASGETGMGDLFKVLALSQQTLPPLPGFDLHRLPDRG